MFSRLPVSWKATGRALLDVLYPLICPACCAGLPKDAAAGDFCGTCQEVMVPVAAPFCQICAEPFPGDIPGDFTCPNCLGRKQAFEFTVCRWLSRGPLREAVHRFKYSRVRSARLALARLMEPALNDPRLAGEKWLLVPVPLHRRKQRQRTYNQSFELAQSLARLADLRMCNALRRIRWTKSQAGLDRAGRLQNLQGAFAVNLLARRRIVGRCILLIDDVLTTGSTAHECALVLKKAGVARVAVLTAARG